jgi:hypothetical protein
MNLSRRTVLRVGAPVVALSAMAAAGGVALAASDKSASGDPVSAPDLGIAAGNDPAANRANLIKALSRSAVSVTFPPGDYLLDNSGAGVIIDSFAGALTMQKDARFVFTDPTSPGLVFHRGTGAVVSGLTTAFQTKPAKRQAAQECVKFDGAVDAWVLNVNIDGSAAAGLLFWRCVRPTVQGAYIRDTMADGLNFSNCQDGRADNVTTDNTGDDGLAFDNYASGPANTGGVATNISVTRSKSRGVAVMGQSGVTIQDVTVNNTVGHGVHVGYSAKWNTRVPTGVIVKGAQITGGGAGTDGKGGVNCGVRVETAGVVALTTVAVDKPGAHGVFVTSSAADKTVSGETIPVATVTITGVSVTSSPATGINLQAGAHTVNSATVHGVDGIGLFASDCKRLTYGVLTLRNTARRHKTHRAVSLENNAKVAGTKLWIYDDHRPATGYVVGAYGPQHGRLGVIVDRVTARHILVDNPSGLSYTKG